MARNLFATTFSTTGFLLFASLFVSLFAVPSRGDEATATGTRSLVSNWSQWRGPNRDGLLSGTSWPDALQDRLKLVWEKKSSPVVVNGFAYMHLKNERFVCIDLKSGEDCWTSKTFGKYWSMVGNVDQRKILALDSDGTLRLIAADPTELRVLDELQVADNAWAHLAVDGSTVVVRALDAIRVFQWR